MAFYASTKELIGKTPLVQLSKESVSGGFDGRLLAKIEMANLSGSVKARIAKAMIEDAEEKGLLNPCSVIIEPTSGNTGIGLALIGAMKGYRVILTMPESMSIERRKLISSYGAEVVLTPAAEGMKGAIETANSLAKTIDGAFIPGQFENPANPKAHYETTGPEIWSDSGENVDVFVAGVGTGGTLSGVGRYLKEKNPSVKIIAVEPATSAVISGNPSGKHGIQGIGAGFIPKTLDTSIIDEVITIEDAEAKEAASLLAKKEGLLVGISSGAALAAAKKIAERDEYKHASIAFVLPDTGERYLA